MVRCGVQGTRIVSAHKAGHCRGAFIRASSIENIRNIIETLLNPPPPRRCFLPLLSSLNSISVDKRGRAFGARPFSH